MNEQHDDLRRRLLAGLPVTDRTLRLGGIQTAVLAGGDGVPMVLLHGSGEFAAIWARVIPELAAQYLVVAADLPGHGGSALAGSQLDVDSVLGWLGELLEQTCPAPAVLVGHGLGGAIAARFTAGRPDRVRQLVLVDALGLAPLAPAASFQQALEGFLGQPTEQTRDAMFRQCFVDLDRLRNRMGARWEPLAAYALDRGRTPDQQSALGTMMPGFGVPAIPADTLARIAVPTALIWGRQDLLAPLSTAELASDRHGWPLYVVDDCGDDPALEQPEAFLDALRAALAAGSREGADA